MTSDNVFAPTLVDTRPLLVVKFNGNCLIRSIITAFRKLINLYISYTLNIRLRDLNKGFTWDNCLFWSVNLTKNADPDKNTYSGQGIGFDTRSQLSLPGGSFGKNGIIFRVDNSSSVHVDNNKKEYPS